LSQRSARLKYSAASASAAWWWCQASVVDDRPFAAWMERRGESRCQNQMKTW
jgi:hypothetical protein